MDQIKLKHTINSVGALSSLIGDLRELFKIKKYFQVKINTGKARTLSQNALQHVWYEQVSKEEREHTAEGVKCLCKLHLGLPILRAADEEYNQACVDFIDCWPYEKQVEAMKWFPVTRLMKTDQLSRYMEQVQAHYISRVALEFPS